MIDQKMVVRSSKFITLFLINGIKPGCIEEVKNWFQTLREKPNEVLLSLENEGVMIESVFLDRLNQEDYLIYYMQAENLTRAREIAMKSTLAIDKYHRECFKKFCEKREKLELLLDFHRI